MLEEHPKPPSLCLGFWSPSTEGIQCTIKFAGNPSGADFCEDDHLCGVVPRWPQVYEATTTMVVWEAM